MNMIKMLWCRFEQCLGTFTMLFSKGSSETWLFRHLCNLVFGVRKFRNTKAMRVIFFAKTFKVSGRLQKSSRKLRKTFCFWDNCISIGIVKLSLLRRGYFSSAANVLQAVPRFDMSITETFPNSIDLAVINECDKIAVIKI